MIDLNAEITNLYKSDPTGAYGSESEYRRDFEKTATALFEKQSPELQLPERTFQVFVLSMIRDHALTLTEAKKRIFKSAQTTFRPGL